MRTFLFAVVLNVCLIGGLAKPANASFIRAQDLYQSCQEFSEFCFGYMGGAYDGVYRAFLNRPGGFCLDPQFSLRNLREAYIDFVSKTPAVLNGPASDALVKALLSAYPCPQNGTPKNGTQ